ncbi:hypothetical protein VTJ04DRAFT_6411 [Mycothermus thermophilus]|uniref:uncharacterized protein n=1 Tax=Humicola insolens TaxID=85995 RepID=UPI003742253A
MSLGVQGLLYTRLAKRRQIQKNDSMAEGLSRSSSSQDSVPSMLSNVHRTLDPSTCFIPIPPVRRPQATVPGCSLRKRLLPIVFSALCAQED